MVNIRGLAVQITLILCGAGLGLAFAWFAADALELRTGQQELQQYAGHLLHTAEGIAKEARDAGEAVLADKLPFCSDQELAFMRRIVFYSIDIKDLGRLKDGKLYCTTANGKLPTPLTGPAPDATDRDIEFYALTPLAVAPDSKGLVVALSGVSAVLNVKAYNESFDAPPMTFTGLFFARESRQTFYAVGHHEPLSNPEVLAQRLVEHNGVFYQPLCSSTRAVCIVAAEPHAAMLARNKVQFSILLTAGVLLGGLIPLIFILFFRRQRSFERRLRRAVRRDELTLAYQPIVDLNTLAIVGAEALVRWTNESDEPVPVEVLVSVAEQRGFIGEITRLVLRHVLEEMHDLLSRGNFEVTINITMQDLGSPEFFELLRQSLENAKIAPAALGLEITERSTADRAAATLAISLLKASGHKVYIDDFGTGYSSLAYLHDLAADAIKIDRTFAGTVGTQAVTASVVPQILDMASRLNLMVVVEGIESEQQLEYFSQAGRGILGQGWLFGKPLPATQFQAQFGAALSGDGRLPVQITAPSANYSSPSRN